MPRIAKWLGDAVETLMPSKMPLMTVAKITSINSAIKRIQFSGNLAGMNCKPGYAVLIRVNDTEFRNYTPSFYDAEKGILEIIFHLHGPAAGSHYINQLTVGDVVRISMPRGQKQYTASAKQYLIFGDETSLGMMLAFQYYLNKNQQQFQYYLELDEQNADVPRQLGLENYSIYSKQNTFKDELWLKDLPIFGRADWDEAYFILTGNVKSVQTFRKILKAHDIKGRIFVKGYWLEGKTGL